VFALSKIVTLFVQPSSLALVALISGLWLSWQGRRSRWAARLAWGGAVFLLFAGIFPLGNILILPLEQRFAGAKAPGPGDRIDGIIILGGFEDGWVSAGRGSLTVNEAAERLTEGVRLAVAYPKAKIVFSGGVGTLWRPGEDATGPVQTYFRAMGIAAERIVLEGKSRNTQENGIYMAEMLQPKPAERWLLITSAYHMPRSVGVFRRAGFEVIAYPVDFRTRGVGDATRLFDSIPAGLMRLDLAVKEWVGLISYRLLGRTNELLPGP
jgi:uncharacterized SAM-binding protein YcdF (DUF218 family)